MTIIGGAFLLLGAIGFGAWLHACCTCFRDPEAVSLNLEPAMSFTLNLSGPGSVAAATLSPKNASGGQAPVFDVQYSATTGSVVLEPAADGMSCKVTAAAVGTATLTVTAKSKAGVTLTDSADFEVVADEEAVSLGLQVG